MNYLAKIRVLTFFLTLLRKYKSKAEVETVVHVEKLFLKAMDLEK